MPKIEVLESTLFELLGKEFDESELVDLLVSAKAELDERMPEKGILKIELNDTNRPDLWSTAGLARQLHSGLKDGNLRGRADYDFFSNPERTREPSGGSVTVDPGLRSIRPYIAAFVAQGKLIDEPLLKDIIQSQEKLCGNFGQNRKTISMGVYREDLIKFPVRYLAADPEETRFVPLGMEEELNLIEILDEHPKGVEFGQIVSGFDRFPYLVDGEGGTLSFPPIINSARIGAVEVGDSRLFIELTGTDMDTLLLAVSISACDLADMGFEILPVRIEYPYDTPYGREIISPFYFQERLTLRPEYANSLLGENMRIEEMASILKNWGHRVEVERELLTLYPPVFRNDFLHAADIVEEIMIARGMETFEPVMPEEYTIGRLSEAELFSRDIREIMVGLGFQEMIFNYLGSKKDFIENMNITAQGFIEIQNPMTLNYSLVRKSILPNLLSSEAVSGNAVYPHKIFEIGKVVFKATDQNYGALSRTMLSFLVADREADFNDIISLVSAIFYYTGREYSLTEVDDIRFIKGRAVGIFCGAERVGLAGEINPEVLENWGIQMPCACAEINLDTLLDISP